MALPSSGRRTNTCLGTRFPGTTPDSPPEGGPWALLSRALLLPSIPCTASLSKAGTLLHPESPRASPHEAVFSAEVGARAGRRSAAEGTVRAWRLLLAQSPSLLI